jgi:hypothetical protein
MNTNTNTNANHADYLSAGNPGTSPTGLMTLAQHESAKVRARVAENISASSDVLDLLSRDRDCDVRLAVASNRRIPPVVLWRLATDECADVRFFLAENPRNELELLIYLISDENPYVVSRAEQTIESILYKVKTKGGHDMSANKLEQTVRRAMRKRHGVNKVDAAHIKEMVLADGYVSRGERKVIARLMENGLLDDDALDVFIDLLLSKPKNDRAIA